MSDPDPAAITPVRETAGLDPINALTALDNTTHANFIETIVGRPKGAPSKKELDYYNPSVAASTLTGHLNRLEEVGHDGGRRTRLRGLERGQLYRFFQLTEAARELFD
jgi:hypothetical protein